MQINLMPVCVGLALLRFAFFNVEVALMIQQHFYSIYIVYTINIIAEHVCKWRTEVLEKLCKN